MRVTAADVESAGHVPQPADSGVVPAVTKRARYVRLVTPPGGEADPAADPERRRLAFAKLLEPRGTATAIAEAWGVSKTLVHQVKAGDKRLTNERIAALPLPLLFRFRRILESFYAVREPRQLLLPGSGKW